MKNLSDMLKDEYELKNSIKRKNILDRMIEVKYLFGLIPDDFNEKEPLIIETLQLHFNNLLTAFKAENLESELPELENELIREQIQIYTLIRDDLNAGRVNRKKANCYVKFMETKEKAIANAKPVKESGQTVKSILLAHYYMRKNNIYPIPEMAKRPFYVTEFAMKLHEQYGQVYESFKNDYYAIFGFPKKKGHDRLKYPENIRLSIELMKTFPEHSNKSKAIELAEKELIEAELKK